jgi:uncharacterized membrane protein YoaK (UPF0700 family)
MEDPGSSTDENMLQQEDGSEAAIGELSLEEEDAEASSPEPLSSDPRREVEQQQQEEKQQQQKQPVDDEDQTKNINKQQVLISILRVKLGLAIAYSFIAGWGDVLAFVHFRALSCAMTGNMVLLGAAIGGNEKLIDVLQPLWFYPATMACNVAGAGVGYFLQGLSQQQSNNNNNKIKKKNSSAPGAWWSRVSTSTTCRTAAFSFTMSLSGALLYVFTKSHLSVWLFTASFGAQNVFTSKFLGVSTAIMTGNMQKVGELLATTLLLTCKTATTPYNQQENRRLSREQLLTFLIPISAASATLAGAIFGGILTGVVGFKGGSASLTIAILQLAPYVLSEVLLTPSSL